MKGVHGKAAVYYAASNGYLGVLEVIAARGGDLEALDASGSIPLDCARERGQVDVMGFLKRKKVKREMGRREKGGRRVWVIFSRGRRYKFRLYPDLFFWNVWF